MLSLRQSSLLRSDDDATAAAAAARLDKDPSKTYCNRSDAKSVVVKLLIWLVFSS